MDLPNSIVSIYQVIAISVVYHFQRSRSDALSLPVNANRQGSKNFATSHEKFDEDTFYTIQTGVNVHSHSQDEIRS